MRNGDRRFGWMSLLFVVAVLAIGGAGLRADAPASQAATAPAAAVGPRVVYLIRHGEKPESGADGDLAAKGFERAKALVGAFPAHFEKPDFIVATAHARVSNRPFETVEPLAAALHLKIDNSYGEDEVERLAHAVLTKPEYAGKVVLICWHHGKIPDLAKALGAKGFPGAWNPERFDRVWRLSFSVGKIEFKDLPEEALPGRFGEIRRGSLIKVADAALMGKGCSECGQGRWEWRGKVLEKRPPLLMGMGWAAGLFFEGRSWT